MYLCCRHKSNPRLARSIDIMFTLHAEYEINCSWSRLGADLASSAAPANCGWVAVKQRFRLFRLDNGGREFNSCKRGLADMLNVIGCVFSWPVCADVWDLHNAQDLLRWAQGRVPGDHVLQKRLVDALADLSFAQDVLSHPEALSEFKYAPAHSPGQLSL